MKLVNLTLHDFPPLHALDKYDLDPVGPPLGRINLAEKESNGKMTSEEILALAHNLIGMAEKLSPEAVMVGGLTSLHYHLINLAFERNWCAYEAVSTSLRHCPRCHFEERGRFDECPKCNTNVVAKFEFAGMREIIGTIV